jgi:hypothetical protein
VNQLPDEPPPFLGTWTRVYTAVACFLVILILLFYWFTRTFNR